MEKKPTEQKSQVRFPLDLFLRMKQLAKQHNRSLNGEIIYALRLYVSQQEHEEQHTHG